MSDGFTFDKKIKRDGGPYKLRHRDTKLREAWFYTNRGSIDVCVYLKDVGTETARIPLKTLRRIVAVLDRKP